MKIFSSKAKAKFGVIGGAIALGATNASAAVDVTGVILDVKSVETMAATMLAALSLIWVARRLVSFLR